MALIIYVEYGEICDDMYNEAQQVFDIMKEFIDEKVAEGEVGGER